MAMIKSALELALEKTRDMKVDEAAVKAAEAKTAGKKAAGRYLEDAASEDLARTIASQGAESREAFRRAVFDVLLALVQLPSGEIQAEKLASVTQGLEIVAGAADRPSAAKSQAVKQAAEMMRQVGSFMARYLEDMKQVDQAIRTQWAPKLREKERQASARMGREVRLDPMADKEFSEFYKQNVDQARAGYQQALDGAKADLAILCGFAPSGDPGSA